MKKWESDLIREALDEYYLEQNKQTKNNTQEPEDSKKLGTAAMIALMLIERAVKNYI